MIPLQNKNKRGVIQKGFYLLLLGAFIVYVYFGFERYLRGPIITVDPPLSTTVLFSEPYLEITGEAHNIAFAWLNGRQIYTDDDGKFSEGILLLPGYNIIEFRARDSFGRSIEKRFEVSLDEQRETRESLKARIDHLSTSPEEDEEIATSTAEGVIN